MMSLEEVAENITSVSPPPLPPEDKPNDGGEKRVIIAHIYREMDIISCEGCLHFNPDFVYWDLNPLGFMLINAHTMEFENVLNLSAQECENIQLWTRHGYDYLVGGRGR
jgi:hypothetical protein